MRHPWHSMGALSSPPMVIAALLPHNERERMHAVRECALLDTPREGSFDELTELAARLMQAPIALVTVVDEARQWFMSHHGLATRETPREFSFCAHAILAPGELFEVPDAAADVRFADNPLVTSEPFIRFYAGVPLTTPAGFALGTLAVIDRVPRRLDEAQRRMLLLLAHQVAAQVELRHLAVQLRQARDAAERVNLAKTHFVASMSHELRTPLNAVLGFSNLLLNQHASAGDSRHTQWLQHIRRAGEHMLQLVRETLDLALIEAGAMTVSPVPMALDEVLRELPALVEQQAHDAGVQVIAAATPALPPVRTDCTRLNQILLNLLSNAIKYNHRGGQVQVGATVDEDGAHVKIEVSDTGRGLDPTQLASLFQPFNRLGAEGGPVEGTGLGLALAHRLAGLMHGELTARSAIGVGSTFTLRLPRA